MKTIEILERVRIISPIVEPLYTRNWMNCAGWWISSDVEDCYEGREEGKTDNYGAV